MKKRALVILSMFLFSNLFLAESSIAAVFNVTTPAEFQDALTTAEGNGQNDTINVAAGNYDVSGGGLTYSGAAEGFSLTIEGAGAATTILDGGGAVQILNINASTSAGTVTVRGMTFQNGAFSIAPPGTLRVVATNITLENSRFLDNRGPTPPFPGGGGANLTALGVVTVTGCEFRNNSGDVGAGGLNINNQGTTVVSKNRIVQNRGGTSGAGGAWIRNTGFVGGSITLVNNIIDNNSFSAAFLEFSNGGGLAVRTSAISGATTVTLTNNTVVSNSSILTGSNGGTVIAVNSATTTIDLYNNIFFGNLSGSPGPTPASSDLSAGFVGAPLNVFNNIVGTSTVVGNVSEGNNLTSDPLLDADAHLQAGSPAIDNGANAAPSVPSDDIDGDARPLDGDGNSVAVVDIGADEALGAVIPVPDIAVNPTSFTFPDVPLTQSSTTEVTLSNTGTDDLHVTGIALATGTHYSVAVGGSNACPSLAPTIAAGSDCTIEVTFTPKIVANNITDTLTIMSDDPDEGSVNVPLSGNGIAGPTPDISVDPTSIDFGNVVADGSSSPDHVVTVSNIGTDTLNVSGISVDDPSNFTLDPSGGPNGCGTIPPSLPLAPTDNCTVTVAFKPTGEGNFPAILSVESDDPDTPIATVSLSGTGTAAPAPDISVPASVDLGEVVVNDTSAPTEVTISNVGDLDLHVTSIALDAGTDFTLDLNGGSSPCNGAIPTLAASGGSCTVAVVFAPLSVGALLDNLTITSDDSDELTVKVSLSGTGLDNVTPVVSSATGSGDITLDTSGNPGTAFTGVRTLEDTDASLDQTGKPPEPFPHGILAFTLINVLSGGTVTVDITYPAVLPDGSRYFEVGDGGFAPLDNVVGNGMVSLTLTDGGAGDNDGTANGTIVHAGGVAVPASVASGGGDGCSCRIAGDGWSFAGGAPTAAILLLPFLWLAVARRRHRRKP